MSQSLKLSLLGSAAFAFALSGCAAVGGSIPSASAPITQSEAEQGAKAHPQLLAEFGGAMT